LGLPAEAKEEDISAAYDHGILTVRVPLGEAKQPVRRISVTRGG